jgi:hypothetical protein
VILDHIVQIERPVDADDILPPIRSDYPDLKPTRDEIIALLDKLEKDHYLVRVGNGDRISSELLARIWRHHRRLG